MMRLSFSTGFLIYFPFLILASAGFSASSGIPQTVPMRIAPGDATLAAQNLNTASGDIPAFGGLRDR